MRTTTRMTRGRATALLATAAATALVLTGCSSGGNAADNGGGEISGTITLQTWALTPTYTGYLNGVIKDFEQAHPDAKVKLQDQPGDGYADKVLSQASSNSLPDVINLPPDIAYPLVAAGKLVEVKEKQMDAVTALSGSGPAYFFLVAEALVDAGVSLGLPRDLATELASATAAGAGAMLEGEQTPAELRAGVSSPAGTTVAAIRELEESGLRGAFYRATEACANRSAEIG